MRISLSRETMTTPSGSRLLMLVLSLWGMGALWGMGIAAGPVRAQDAGVADAHIETVAEFESHDPFARDPADDELGAGPADPMAVGADDDPALALPPPTEDELLEPPVRVTHGAVLEAIAGVRATEHRTEIRLGHGLMLVEEALAFTSSARHRAEVLYRLAVPAGAHVVGLEVCNDVGCRTGLTETRASGEGAYDDALVVRAEAPTGLPVAHVARDEGTSDASVLVVRAAPVLSGRNLRVTVRWVAVTPTHGGALRVTLPSLGADARVPLRSIALRGDDVVEPTLDGSVIEPGEAIELPLSQPIRLGALLPRSSSTDHIDALVVPCGESRCVRARVTGPPPRPRARTVILAIDASPSTTIGARGRITDAVRVLLGMLGESSLVVPYAFAARAQALSAGPVAPASLDLGAIRDATSNDLGASTRFEALVAQLREDGQLTRGAALVVIGDGGITSSPGSFQTWADLSDLNVAVSSVNVADRSTTLALATAIEGTGGVVIDAGDEAASASNGRGDELLTERLSALFSSEPRTVTLQQGAASENVGVLRDGEDVVLERVLEARLARGATIVAGGRAGSSARLREADADFAAALEAHLTHRTRMVAVDPSDLRPESGACADDGTRRSRRTEVASALLGAGRARVALSARRSCTLPATVAPERARGLPSRPLLTQLRRRVIPVARGCFRDDRRGRADYSTRADIRVTLADREIVSTEVDGPITPELASCLASAFDGLDIPAFDGTVVVHWPLYTAAEPPPPTLELAPDISRAVDRIGIE